MMLTSEKLYSHRSYLQAYHPLVVQDIPYEILCHMHHRIISLPESKQKYSVTIFKTSPCLNLTQPLIKGARLVSSLDGEKLHMVILNFTAIQVIGIASIQKRNSRLWWQNKLTCLSYSSCHIFLALPSLEGSYSQAILCIYGTLRFCPCLVVLASHMHLLIKLFELTIPPCIIKIGIKFEFGKEESSK